MLTRRFVLTGMVAAPAVIVADRLMPVRTIIQRYATVYGVGHDLEVVEWIAWNAEDALRFATFRGGIDKFREVKDIVYGFPMPPLPEPIGPSANYVSPSRVTERDVRVKADGFTIPASFSKLNEWREGLRPDLDGHRDHRWVQEQIAACHDLGIDPLA